MDLNASAQRDLGWRITFDADEDHYDLSLSACLRISSDSMFNTKVKRGAINSLFYISLLVKNRTVSPNTYLRVVSVCELGS